MDSGSELFLFICAENREIYAPGPRFVLHLPESKVHGTNMGPIRVLSAPDGPHVGSMNLAIRGGTEYDRHVIYWIVLRIYNVYLR